MVFVFHLSNDERSDNTHVQSFLVDKIAGPAKGSTLCLGTELPAGWLAGVEVQFTRQELFTSPLVSHLWGEH